MGPNQTKSYKANSIIYLKAGGYSSLVWNFSVLVHCNGSVTPTVLWVALLSQFFQGYSTPQVLSEIILAPYETREGNNFIPLSHWWVWQPWWSWKSPSKLSFLSLKNITYLQQNSSMVQSQSPKILTAFFYSFLLFLSPLVQTGSIFAGGILIPGFCWNVWLSLWVISMISLLNICSVTPFLNMDRLRICQNFKLWLFFAY